MRVYNNLTSFHCAAQMEMRFIHNSLHSVCALLKDYVAAGLVCCFNADIVVVVFKITSRLIFGLVCGLG